jgi:hypothetical protein
MNQPLVPTAEVENVLHENVGRILGPDETRLDHPEPGLHEEDQERSQEHPEGVDGTERRSRLDNRIPLG